MKKIFIAILIIVAMVSITSCGSAIKAGHGVGVGTSQNEQVAKDKALANGFADLSFSDETKVNGNITVSVEDVNGKVNETTTTVKNVSTQGTYTQNNKEFVVSKAGDNYNATISITGKRTKSK